METGEAGVEMVPRPTQTTGWSCWLSHQFQRKLVQACAQRKELALVAL